MFKELYPLVQNRPLTITVAVLSGGQIRVNVIPQSLEKDDKVNDKVGYAHKDKVAKVPDSAITALTTPLSLTGLPEEIDVELSRVLTQFTESHVQLQTNINQAQAQIASAVQAIQEREKEKEKEKKAKPGATTTKTDAKSDANTTKNQDRKDEVLPLWCAAPASAAASTAETASPQQQSEPPRS